MKFHYYQATQNLGSNDPLVVMEPLDFVEEVITTKVHYYQPDGSNDKYLFFLTSPITTKAPPYGRVVPMTWPTLPRGDWAAFWSCD